MPKKAWSTGNRKKLSAIRHPEQGVPKGFYFTDRASAAAALADSAEYPDTLTLESEKARAESLRHRGISWKTTTGRNFTSEFPNPLFGLWTCELGLDFALDMLLPDPASPDPEQLGSQDGRAYWCGLRRYLFAASDEDYARLKARVAPVFEAGLTSDDHRHQKVRDYIALAFSRQSDWADALLQGYLKKTVNIAEMDAVLAATTDAKLAAKVIKKHGKPWWIHAYHAFDMVESLGPAAADVLPLLNERRSAPDRKRILAGVAIAEKLKAG